MIEHEARLGAFKKEMDALSIQRPSEVWMVKQVAERFVEGLLGELAAAQARNKFVEAELKLHAINEAGQCPVCYDDGWNDRYEQEMVPLERRVEAAEQEVERLKASIVTWGRRGGKGA